MHQQETEAIVNHQTNLGCYLFSLVLFLDMFLPPFLLCFFLGQLLLFLLLQIMVKLMLMALVMAITSGVELVSPLAPSRSVQLSPVRRSSAALWTRN